MQNTLLVFSYDFSHKKSFLFLKEIFKRKDLSVIVYAAPWVSLKGQEPPADQDFHPKNITKKYGHKYVKGSHKDVDTLKKIILENSIKTAIIGGARIIPENVISLFEHGIINFHPGPIPETSGLDSFFWMIQKKSLPGITIHYIDKKVDAGEIIFFHHKEDIKEDDDINKVRSSMLLTQIDALKRLLSFLKVNKKMISKKILNHKKNNPMNQDEIENATAKFNYWKIDVIKKQYEINNIYEAISNDNVSVLLSLDKPFLEMLKEYKNNSGRSILAESAYYHSQDCLKYMLSNGFNVNDINDKGTTVLMYAKTKLLNKKLTEKDRKILELILSYNPNMLKKDIYEKNIYDYIPANKNIELLSILGKKNNLG
tara:strand:+ start:4560 stop:5669 length:1110 start_codon:yes stop_codon:yes gene_type:complete